MAKEIISDPTYFFQTLSKRQFLCGRDYDEPYFDWNCELAKGVPPEVKKGQPVEWYPICGTPFTNRAEYVVLVYAWCLFGLFVFYKVLGRTLPVPPIKVYKRKQKTQ